MVSPGVLVVIFLLTALTGSDGDNNGCKIKTTTGECCVFPFIFRNQSYNSCTTYVNGNTPWCATTDNCDRDHKWANCKIVDPCNPLPCKNGGTCSIDSETCFKCKCPYNFEGFDCSKKYVPISCKDFLQRDSTVKDGVYTIKTNTRANYSKVYCQMTPLPGCSGRGWTLVMKTDGNKETFSYSSSYWQNEKPYNPRGGLSGTDNIETKLPTYWSTPFQQLCVGMKVGNDLKFISINYTASSLHSLIADGQYRPTNIGRRKWKSLIRGSSLQQYCNREGFNLVGKNSTTERVRLGIISNNEDDCATPDSFIGFGGTLTSYRYFQCRHQRFNSTCGNVGECPSPFRVQVIRAIGYIFVR